MREQKETNQENTVNVNKQMANSDLKEGTEMREYLLMNILKHSINICRFLSFFPSCHLHKDWMIM